jgi:hypothetical protein
MIRLTLLSEIILYELDKAEKLFCTNKELGKLSLDKAKVLSHWTGDSPEISLKIQRLESLYQNPNKNPT